MPLRSEPRELKHLSTGRRRKRIDSVSSGERKRRSPKWGGIARFGGERPGRAGHRGRQPRTPRRTHVSPREYAGSRETPAEDGGTTRQG